MPTLKPSPKRLICGIDEAGYGTWAGPVYVSGVILDPDNPIEGLADSKALKPSQREILYTLIMERALAISTAIISHDTIDTVNIYNANMEGMLQVSREIDRRARQLSGEAFYHIDGENAPKALKPRCRTIVGGDATDPAISAASIVAKVERDRHMEEMGLAYPGYGFEKHKGYGTKLHREMLMEHGPSPIHRMTFKPMKEMV